MKAIILLLSALISIPQLAYARHKQIPQKNHRDEYVVLLHGLHRSSLSMHKLDKAFRRAGYNTLNINYPSTKMTIEELVDWLHPTMQQIQDGHPKAIHFVGHSMGNLIIRGYINKYQPAIKGRVVMLGPPNSGSEIADHLRVKKFYQWLYGPALQELGTDQSKLTYLSQNTGYEVGIIAGDRSNNPIYSSHLPKPHDGIVSVASTHLPDEKDHKTLHTTHSFIMYNKHVIRNSVNFINEGKFSS